MKEKLKVPKLRFKEFSGELNEDFLLNLSINGFSNGVFNDPKKVGSGYKIINVKDMYVGNKIDVNTLTLLELEEKEFLKNKVENGDIFFTRSSLVKEGIAYSNIYLDTYDDITYDGHLIRMRPNKEKVFSKFLSYDLLTTYSRKQFMERGKTTTMTTIGQEDIGTVKIFYPSLPEQQKIADFLFKVDEKIEKLTKKKELLEQYKKGVMQKIFSQELRFKDDNGNDFPDWEEKELGEVIKAESSSISANTLEENYGEYPIYGATGYLKSINTFDKESDYISIVKDGAGVGRLLYCKGFSSILGTLQYLLPKKTENLKFLYFILSNINFDKYKVGSTIPHIYFKDYSLEKLSIPSLPEQQKIADFLSALDKKIDVVSQELGQVQEFKKGLLQQMFV